MKEIEVKILEVDVESIRAKLKNLGAEKVFDGEMDSLAFDYPDKMLENEGKLIRLRKAGGSVFMTFKSKNQSTLFKSMEELEVQTSDFAVTASILESIGFKQVRRWTKKRESYRLGRVKFEIDTYPGIPSFLEIESDNEDEVAEFVSKLGYKMEHTTNMGGSQVVAYYENKKKEQRII